MVSKVADGDALIFILGVDTLAVDDLFEKITLISYVKYKTSMIINIFFIKFSHILNGFVAQNQGGGDFDGLGRFLWIFNAPEQLFKCLLSDL